MKKITLFLLALFACASLFAQTADKTKGCIPLQVNFTSPTLSDYYWQFGDGGDSPLKDPSRNYTSPGIYLAELFEGVGGTKIGEIEITVLAVPEIMIDSDVKSGCSPLQVSFTNESTLDPNSEISGYFWDFGDGTNSTEENPTHVYNNEGVFPVSLRIASTLDNCTETENFEEFISVSGNISAGFSLDKTVACEAPATFNITNNTTDGSGYTYAWNFGNGDTATGYDPPDPTYNEEGDYTIKMTVDSGDGCVVTLSRTVTVGKPKINFDFPDTVCIGEPYLILNNTQANAFSWTFGGASPGSSTQRNPAVTFNTPGTQIVTFSAIASTECQADTFFNVFVEDPSAAFAIDPEVLCTDPAIYSFSPSQTDLQFYFWEIADLDTMFAGGPGYVFTYDEPARDSFYISRQDTFTVVLTVQSHAGCIAIDSTDFHHWAPRAHFVPNRSRGCAPLTIDFDEVSESNEDIVSWEWTFGDGTGASSNDPDDMSHTYNEPGEYWVHLIIENEAGCRDTSEGVVIYVGEKLDSDYIIDKTEICLNDTVSFEALNLDPRIDAWHFDTDDSRISDCYETPGAQHTFVHAPGTYPVTLTLEYNGCFNEINNGQSITVNGSKARIKYMTNCNDPYTVMFQDSSLNATTSIWYLNGDTINMDTISGDVFNYTFDSTGNYVVKLWTDDNTACEPDSMSVDIYIRDIQANFDLPEKICAFEPIIIDASASVDVDNTCSKGYEWFGVARRPRMIDRPDVRTSYLPGPITVRLIVEDVNGCKDTLDRESQAYDIRADFETDKTKICFPSDLSFTDLSVADTTITEWQWSFGSVEQNPQNELFNESPGPFLPIDLIVTDVLGCKDTTQINIPTYEVTTDIDPEPGFVVCVGDSIHLTTTDFTQEGSFLHFDWDFEGSTLNQKSDEQNPSFIVLDNGMTKLSLKIEEDATGCTNEYLLNVTGITPPDADFTVDAEDQNNICPNAIVVFNNQSTIDDSDNATWQWNFGNGNFSDSLNTSSFYESGTYDVTFSIFSVYGCSDSHTEQITLIGPEGDFEIDKEILCLGDTVTFTLLDTTGAATFEWDFGDGVTLANENPIPHPYTFLADSLEGVVNVSLILTSESDCKTSIVRELQISDLEANFGIIIDTINICNKEIQFIDSSLGNIDTYFWDFGNGVTSEDANPVVLYSQADTFEITLTVESFGDVCTSSAVDTFVNEVLNQVRYPTVFSPNNDNRNDFFDIIIEQNQRECIEVVKCKIFNRWGNMIYDNELPPDGWDGRYENGEDAPAEIYTYVMEVLYSTGETESKKGTFTLIR